MESAGPADVVSLARLAEVEDNPDIVEYLRRLARDDPQRIKDRISFEEATGDFVVTLWDRSPQDRAGIRVTQQDLQLCLEHQAQTLGAKPDPHAPLWPQILKIAYAKSSAFGAKSDTGE